SSTLSYNSAGGSWASYTESGGGTAVGGGILNAGTLTLDGCVLSGNEITSDSLDPLNYVGDTRGQGFGGGVYTTAAGSLTVSLSILRDDQAFGSARWYIGPTWGGGNSGGGALFVAGTATVSDTQIDTNYANFWTRTFTYGYAMGGGAYVADTGSLTLDRVTFSGN